MLLLQEKKTAIGVHAMYVHSIFFQGGKRREKNIYAVIRRFFLLNSMTDCTIASLDCNYLKK